MSLARRVRDPVGGRQRLGVLLESLHAEELRDDRLFELELRTGDPPANTTGRIPEGLVRCHLPIWANGPIRPVRACTWGTCR